MKKNGQLIAIPGQPVAIFGYPNGAIFPDRRYVQYSTGVGRLVRKNEEKNPKKLKKPKKFRRLDSQKQLRIAFLVSGQLWIARRAIWLSGDSPSSYLVICGQLRELSGYLGIAKDSSGQPSKLSGYPGIAPGAIWVSGDSQRQLWIAQRAIWLSADSPASYLAICGQLGTAHLDYQRQFRIVSDCAGVIWAGRGKQPKFLRNSRYPLVSASKEAAA